MKILVTGAAGFIGSHFVKNHLAEHPADRVVTLDSLTYAGHTSNLGEALKSPRHKFVKGDIRDAGLLKRLLPGVDAVVHFAAETHVDRSLLSGDEFIQTNIQGTFTLAGAARAAGVKRFVHVSTDEVYGSVARGRTPEGHPFNPSSPYAASKAASDHMAFSFWHTFRYPVMVTRCTNNFGPSQYPEKFLPLFITNAMDDRPLPLYGKGTNVRNWIHVLDHCEALELVLRKGRPGEAYNVAGDKEWRNIDVARAILKRLGKSASLLHFVTDRAGHDVRYAPDARKIQRELGWKVRRPFAQALPELIAWYEDNQAWWRPLKADKAGYGKYYAKQYASRGEKVMKKNVAVVGTGYVGLVTGACLAEIGHNVVCVDNNPKKIASLKKGVIPIYEPGLEDVVKKNRKNGRLSFAGSIEEGMKDAELVFIAVNTPPKPDGEADLSFVEAAAREVARRMKRYTVVVDKSTVPVHTGEKVQETLRLHGRPGAQFDVASNPEFLREGTAVKDFLHPDRIVIGVDSPKAEKALRDLYAPLKATLLVTDIKSAELIKHSSNSFLAMKISFINAVSRVCEKVGADVSLVAEGMGHDARIGKSFLKAGLGFGGSCFPKDLSAYVKMAEEAGYDFELLKAVQKINADQRLWAAQRLKKALWTLRGKTIALWGLAFKPDTDDLRNAPALDIAAQLIGEGCIVRVHDPVAMAKAKELLPGAQFAKDAYDAAKGADAVVLVTEWKEYKEADLKKVRALVHTPVFLDGRNVFSPKAMAALGFQYHSVGRPS